jgi:hypothetical protein
MVFFIPLSAEADAAMTSHEIDHPAAMNAQHWHAEGKRVPVKRYILKAET